MKTIEEKARAYDEALERAIKLQENSNGMILKKWLTGVFPELKESEDERIRKAIIETLKCDSAEKCLNSFGVNIFAAIAWLEKQGEQKPQGKTALEAINEKVVDNANKVEPKFHEGDLVVIQETTYQISKVEGLNVTLSLNGRECMFSVDVLKNAHFWTIQDAKDGDVLATSYCILIFKKHLPKDGGVSYCHYDFGCSTPQFNFNEDNNWYFGTEAKIYPATKEQRDTLFAEMHKAGYMWDSEGKQLLSLKAEPNNEQKPAEWSEEDEKMINGLLLVVEEWYNNQSEEEKEYYGDCGYSNWLKSLKPQNHWKPSEEQMEAFRRVYDWYNINFMESETLNSLYEDMKKLK